MLWLFYMLLIKVTSCVMMTKVVMSRYPALDGRNITTSIISLTTGPLPEQEALSIAYCAEKCAHAAECASFFFNFFTNQCQFHEDLFIRDDGAAVQPGMRYYYKKKGKNGWCPAEKGFQLLTENGPCVKFHNDSKTWYKASETCEAYSPNARLVVLDNQEKNELVKAAGMAINDHFVEGIAIGLADLSEGIYRWVDGRKVNFTDWYNNDLTVAGEDNCVRLKRGSGWRWFRKTCTSLIHYICEIVVDINF